MNDNLFGQLLARDDTYVRDGGRYRRLRAGDNGMNIFVRNGDAYIPMVTGDSPPPEPEPEPVAPPSRPVVPPPMPSPDVVPTLLPSDPLFSPPPTRTPRTPTPTVADEDLPPRPPAPSPTVVPHLHPNPTVEDMADEVNRTINQKIIAPAAVVARGCGYYLGCGFAMLAILLILMAIFGDRGGQ